MDPFNGEKKVIRLLLAFVILTGMLTVAHGTEVSREQVGRWAVSCHVDETGAQTPACFMSSPENLSVQVHPEIFDLWFMDAKWRVGHGKKYDVWVYLDNNHKQPISQIKCTGVNFENEGGFRCVMNMTFANLEVIRNRSTIGVNAGKKYQKWYSLNGSARALDKVLDNLGRIAHDAPTKRKGIDG